MLDTSAKKPHPTGTLLNVAQLEGWYGDSQVLFGVDFHLGEGEVVGLVGRNGAGKTSTLRAIMGLLPKQAGSVTLFGRSATGLRPSDRARLGIGYCPEERAIFTSLTVFENLLLPPCVGAGGMTQAEVIDLFPNLKSRGRHFGGQLSGGEQQMLAIGRILRTGARLLLLDEPTEGLAPVIVKQIERALGELKRRGYTILLVEQNLGFVMRLADRVVVLESGRVVEESFTDEAETARVRLVERLAL